VQLFKTSKVTFIMVISVLLLRKTYPFRAWFYAGLVTLGLYMLSTAEKNSRNSASTEDIGLVFYGFTLMGSSMVLIAFNNVLQETVLKGFKLFLPWPLHKLPFLASSKGHTYSSEIKGSQEIRDEFIFFSNIITSITLFIGSVYYQQISVGLHFFMTEPPRLVVEQSVILLINAYGQRLVLDMTQAYGAVSSTLVVTVRKVLTFFISVFLFPKPFTMYHFVSLVTIIVSSVLLQFRLMDMKASFVGRRHSSFQQSPRSRDAIGHFV
jgi:drug/metabolite transporter (DMT)-like permease